MKKFIGWLLVALLLVVGNYVFVRAGDITPTGMSQEDLVNWLGDARGNFRNACLQKAFLSTNSASRACVNASRVMYTINGVYYISTPGLTAHLPAVQATQAANTYCLYLIEMDSSGNLYANKGTDAYADIAVLPKLTANRAPLGYIKIQTLTATPWTMGNIWGSANSNLTAGTTTGVSAITYYDTPYPINGPSSVDLTGR